MQPKQNIFDRRTCNSFFEKQKLDVSCIARFLPSDLTNGTMNRHIQSHAKQRQRLILRSGHHEIKRTDSGRLLQLEKKRMLNQASSTTLFKENYFDYKRLSKAKKDPFHTKSFQRMDTQQVTLRQLQHQIKQRQQAKTLYSRRGSQSTV